MSKYDAAFAPRDPSELARDAARAATAWVQSSLFNRLKRAFGTSNAGTIAWMMLRAADPSHADHDAACEALKARSGRELAELWSAAEGCEKAARGGALEVARSVRGALEVYVAMARAKV